MTSTIYEDSEYSEFSDLETGRKKKSSRELRRANTMKSQRPKKGRGRVRRTNSDSRSDRVELSPLDERKCKELFNTMDKSGKGYLTKDQITQMLETSLKNIKLEVQGANTETFSNVLMQFGRQNKSAMLRGNTADRAISYDQFQKLYAKYVVGDTGGSDTHNRSSIAVILGQQHKDIAREEQKNDKPVNTLGTSSQQWSVWYEDQKVRLWWLIIFIVLNVASFVWKYTKYCYRNPAAFALSGVGLCYARGFAQVCLLNSLLVLLPLCRSFMDFLRNSPTFQHIVPFDDAILCHKISGYTFVGAGLLHTAGQFYAYLGKVQQASDEVWFNSSLAASGAFPGPRPSVMDLVVTIPGWTGIALVLISFISTPLTFTTLRKANFNWFWYSHILFYPFYMVFTWFHGIGSWLEPTQAYAFCTIPMILFTIDRWDKLKLYANSMNVQILSIDLDKEAVGVIIQKPPGFGNYLPGTYIVLNIPELSTFEWHPFTLTSAPDDDFISVHIRALGDWTRAFHKMMSDYNDNKRSQLPIARVDGPVGAPTQDYLHFDVVLMIGAGIGVTPFASILRDTAYRLRENRCNNCGVVDYRTRPGKSKLKKLYFHWTTRTQSSLQWFSNCMNEVAKLDTEGKIEIHNHLTNIQNNTDDATSVKMAQTLLHNMTGHDLISGLKTRTRTHFGRPDWDQIYSDLVKRHPNERIGVFFCGARSFELRLAKLCRKYSINEFNTTFEFHAEKF